ncbi:MAG: hypothetical protein ACI8UO_002111 [Verrucomicrobiales bacterium]|jgi:hypothetical protein
MHKELLVLTWLNGHVQFVSTSGGRVVATSECDHEVDPDDASADLAKLIQTGAKHANYTGKNLAVVLEHAQLTQQLLETPPAKGRDLELFIERQVDQLKICDGDVAWSFKPTHQIKDSNGLMLYLLPQAICDRLTKAAKVAGLHLLMVVSPGALLHLQIAELPVPDDGIALVAAETQGTTSIVVGRKDGTVFLGRSLHCSWENDPERVASQINRSTVFIRQQFGNDVSQVYLLGRGAENLTEVMSESVELPVTFCDEEITPTHWAARVASQPAEMTANLIGREQQRAPQRRLMVAVTAVLLTMLGAVSIAVCLWIESKIRVETDKVASFQPRLADLQMRKSDLERRLEGLAADEQLATFIEEHKLPPAPGIFLSYLASILPSELILTTLQVKRIDRLSGERDAPPDGLWSVRVEGTVSWDATGEMSSAQVHSAYLGLGAELVEGPFHLSITEKTRQFAPLRDKPAWDVATQGGADQFFIEGVMRGGAVQ